MSRVVSTTVLWVDERKSDRTSTWNVNVCRLITLEFGAQIYSFSRIIKNAWNFSPNSRLFFVRRRRQRQAEKANGFTTFFASTRCIDAKRTIFVCLTAQSVSVRLIHLRVVGLSQQIAFPRTITSLSWGKIFLSIENSSISAPACIWRRKFHVKFWNS